jgi:hypothetical protein
VNAKEAFLFEVDETTHENDKTHENGDGGSR